MLFAICGGIATAEANATLCSAGISPPTMANDALFAEPWDG
jgi:hypothetical protein